MMPHLFFFVLGLHHHQTIDEICDAIGSSELITFASMSEAFDGEDTRQETCDVNQYLPSEGDLLDTAKNIATNLLDSVSYDFTSEDTNIYSNPVGNSLIDIRDTHTAEVTDASDVFGSTAGPNALPLINFALNKPAAQTRRCSPTGEEAGRAVNGWIDTNGASIPDDRYYYWSCTYPNNDGVLFWQVDLEQVRHIAFVKIYNRLCGARMILPVGTNV